jgi:hypothetical protein
MEKTNITQELMLTIDQISQLTGVRKSTLRYWEKSFDNFLKPSRTHSNRREYSLEDLDRVKAIKNLLEQEHLTAYGVRMRLQELFALKGGGAGSQKAGPKIQGKTRGPKRRGPSSAAGKDPAV